jgi:Ca2+-binding EF-hand superfamily protein
MTLTGENRARGRNMPGSARIFPGRESVIIWVMRNRALFLLPLVFTLSGAVWAAEPQSQPQEQQAPQEDPYLKRFQELDRDSDEYVSPGEWPLEADSFTLVDRNKDGRLSKRELLTPNTMRRDEQLQQPAPPRARPDLSRRIPIQPDLDNVWGAYATIQDRRLLRNLDRNGDNRLGRREWAGTIERFHRLDSNGDGVLSPRELSRN